ncbi:MAG TPA: pyruvate kinase [Acetobacteraceae bacterium]|nr:pyruvate kinase [Acetobacteraceae bacterium]
MLDSLSPLSLPSPFEAVADRAAATTLAWQPRIRRRLFREAAHNLALAEALDGLGAGPALERRLLDADLAPADPSALWSALMRAADPTGGPGAAVARRRAALRLAQETRAIFGPVPPGFRGARIVATLGAESAADPAAIAELLRSGVGCVRINTAREDREGWLALAQAVRRASRLAGRACRLLVDLPGPKLRLTEAGGERVGPGAHFVLLGLDGAAPAGWAGPCARIGIPLPRLAPGAEVALDDGKLVAMVERGEAGGAVLRALRAAPRKGLRLRPGRGVHLPEAVVPDLPEPRDALAFAAAEADLVGLSFLRGPDDVAKAREALGAQGRRRVRQGLVLKIETRAALAHLPAILVEAAGVQPTAVMVARGDLMVATGPAALPAAQARILHFAAAAHLPAICATGLLETLVKTGLASRAELLDAACALRGASALMLNRGPHQAEAARLLRDVARAGYCTANFTTERAAISHTAPCTSAARPATVLTSA